MASQNLVSATLSSADLDEINNNLDSIKSKLSFTIALTPQEKRQVFSAGNAYKGFLTLAKGVVDSHPQILTSLFDKQEFEKDTLLASQLEPVLTKVNELAESLRDTIYALNSDSIIHALDVYSAVQSSKDKVAGLEATADAMKQFFKRSRKTVIPQN